MGQGEFEEIIQTGDEFLNRKALETVVLYHLPAIVFVSTILKYLSIY